MPITSSIERFVPGVKSGCSTWQSAKHLILFMASIVAAGFLVSCGSKTQTPVQTPAEGPAIVTNAAPATAPTRPEIARLVGKWERPDGGYILEIRSVDSSGKLDAGYFNPNPINVSRALAVLDAGETKVFIELRDVNYPGCTYSLKYDPKTDQLYGQYFQAAMNETYDVAFGRLK